MKTLLAATLSCLALTACGGGGGTTTSTSGTPTTPAAPTTPTFLFNTANAEPGTAISATVAPDGTLGTFSASNSATLNGSDEKNAIGGGLARRFVSNGKADVLDFATATASSNLGGYIERVRDGDGTEVATNRQPSSTTTPATVDLQFTEYGAWAQFPASGGSIAPGERINYGVFGAPTTPAQMPDPQASNVQYTGRSIGLATNASGAFNTVSDVNIFTDFRNVSVNNSNTLRDDPTDPSKAVASGELDFTATGSISGSGFEATTAGGNMTANGQFYGPNAEEVGGTFSGSQNGFAIGAAFGAKE